MTKLTETEKKEILNDAKIARALMNAIYGGGSSPFERSRLKELGMIRTTSITEKGKLFLRITIQDLIRLAEESI